MIFVLPQIWCIQLHWLGIPVPEYILSMTICLLILSCRCSHAATPGVRPLTCQITQPLWRMRRFNLFNLHSHKFVINCPIPVYHWEVGDVKKPRKTKNHLTCTLSSTSPAATIPSPATRYGKNTCSAICHDDSSGSCTTNSVTWSGTGAASTSSSLSLDSPRSSGSVRLVSWNSDPDPDPDPDLDLPWNPLWGLDPFDLAWLSTAVEACPPIWFAADPEGASTCPHSRSTPRFSISLSEWSGVTFGTILRCLTVVASAEGAGEAILAWWSNLLCSGQATDEMMLQHACCCFIYMCVCLCRPVAQGLCLF